MPVERSPVFVLAHGVDWERARRAHAAVCRVAADAPLYRGDDGPSVLVADDPIEGPLAESVARHVRRLERYRKLPLGSLAAPVEPFGLILVVLSAVGGGVAGAAGADLWAAIKRTLRRAWRWLRRRPAQEGPAGSELARLLDDLAAVYDEDGWPLDAPVLVRVARARITLVVESDLPEEAKRLAEELAAREPTHPQPAEVPLRWDRPLRRWRPLTDQWATWTEIHALGWDVDPARHRVRQEES